jgi:hypothetical protein
MLSVLDPGTRGQLSRILLKHSNSKNSEFAYYDDPLVDFSTQLAPLVSVSDSAQALELVSVSTSDAQVELVARLDLDLSELEAVLGQADDELQA